MQRNSMGTTLLLTAGMTALVLCSSADAVPWDTQLGACEVVNSSNLDLVVLVDTGELVEASGNFPLFCELIVDVDGTVLDQGVPVGFVGDDFDGDGFLATWLFTNSGSLAELNRFTCELIPTGLPTDSFINVTCAACDVWDVLADCIDTDADGFVNSEDACPNSPLDLAVDDTGCACSEIDDDQDGVSACLDVCPNTPVDELPDLVGCSCSQVDSDQDGVNDCADLCPLTPSNLLVDADGCACEGFDDDLDGVDDCFDLCPGTSPIFVVDAEGCSCDDYDDDLDGITNCDDLCPDTAIDAVVDIDGCEVQTVPGLSVLFSLCGSTNAMIFPLMFCGLIGLRRTRRR